MSLTAYKVDVDFGLRGTAIGWLGSTATLTSLTTISGGALAVALTGLVYALTTVQAWIHCTAISCLTRLSRVATRALTVAVAVLVDALAAVLARIRGTAVS
jgi:hypothetical protein